MVKLVLTSLLIKKMTILSIAIAIVSLYLYLRFSTIRSSWRSRHIDKYQSPMDYQTIDFFNHYSCRSGNYVLNCLKNENILETVRELVKFRNFAYGNFFQYNNKRVDLCQFRHFSDCEEVDMREFVVKYFKEIVKPEHGLFELVPRTGKYRFVRDRESEYSPKEQYLRIDFGFMLIFAFGSQFFIDVDFTDITLKLIFEKNFKAGKSYLDTELSDLDPEQFEMYKKISSKKTIEVFTYKSNSLKPFQNCQFNAPVEGSFYNFKFPFNDAAYDLFVRPYLRTISFVQQGLVYMNYSNYFYYTVNLNILRHVLAENKFEIDDFALIDWQNHCTAGRSIRSFWKALKKASPQERFRMFKSISGWKSIPSRDFSRIPASKIIVDYSINEIFLQKPFVISVPAFKKIDEMLQLILNFINKAQT